MKAFLKEPLLSQYEEVLFYIEGLTEPFLHKNHLPQKWSIHQHLCHLGRYQEMFHKRMEKILLEDSPALARYVSDDDPLLEKWFLKPIQEVIDLTQAHRKSFSAQIISFSEETLLRTGAHPVFGSMNMNEWIHFFLLHEKHHIYAIFKLIMGFR